MEMRNETDVLKEKGHHLRQRLDQRTQELQDATMERER